MKWLIIAVVFYGAWRLVPKRAAALVGDTLKLEWIRELQERHAERKAGEFPNLEELQRRFAVKVAAWSVVVCAFTLWLSWSLGEPYRYVFALMAGATNAGTMFRVTHHKRMVVLPLYLTLCRIQGNRWDPHSDPEKWLRVPQKEGRPITLRLPMDWHCGAMQQRAIREIVETRVPGRYKVEVLASKFRMVFRPETSSVIPAENPSQEAPSFTNVGVSDSEEEFEEAEEIEFDLGDFFKKPGKGEVGDPW